MAYEASGPARPDDIPLESVNSFANAGVPRKRNPFSEEPIAEGDNYINRDPPPPPQGPMLDRLVALHGDVPRDLNWQDVAALIINKMIGTGIYTAPPMVLALTASKGEALVLWFVGFVYTLISMVIYLEYARRLPHTGGEVIYLDETLPKPRLLVYTIYAFYSVITSNSAANSLQFANHVLICAAGDVVNPDPEPRSLRFIAIVALSFFSLLHYFSSRVGRDLNQVLAFIKIGFLLIVSVAGIVRAAHHHKADWNLHSNSDVSSSATAFLSILFSFSGWENATYVAGEIPNHRALKKGFIAALFMVGVLYLFINIMFLVAVPYNSSTMEFVDLYFGGGYKARITWAVLIAISATGSLLADIYTSSRVKQVIGMSNILPWSRIWKANSPARMDDDGNVVAVPTPQGGLLLQWIFSVIFICITAGISNTSEAISFPGNLQSYAAGFFGILISLGFPFLFLSSDSRVFKMQFKAFGKKLKLTPRTIPEPLRDRTEFGPEGQEATPRYLRKTYLIFVLAYLVVNGWIIIVPLIPPYKDGLGNKLQIKGWYYIVIVAATCGLAGAYYTAAFGYASVRTGQRGFTHAQIVDQARIDPERRKSIMNIAGVHPEIIEDEYNDPQYGNRRSVEVLVDSNTPSALYLLFGGSKTRHTKDLGVSSFLNMVFSRRTVAENGTSLSDDHF